MYSSFFGLNVALRALSAYQGALNVTGHNIANANTTGYTRQLANIQATTPLSVFTLGKEISLGTGSTLDNIVRARDYYIDRQFRWETSKYEYWAGKENSLKLIEGLMNEPSEYSLHNDLVLFWNAWSELAKNPQNMGARSVLLERAMTLVDTFHHIDQQITDLQNDLDASVAVTVKQINTIAAQIKELNTQIKRAEVAMDNPNDLKDRRDALVDELAKLVPVRVEETMDETFTDRIVGKYKVIIGNENDPANVLVDDQTVNFLEDPPQQNTDGFYQVVWQNTGKAVDLGKDMGKLKADLEIRDEYLPDFRKYFDNIAKGLAKAVNAFHRTGQGLVPMDTGIDFFTEDSGTGQITAASITVNSDILKNVDKIATGKIVKDADGKPTLEVGDSSVALAIAALAQGWESLKELQEGAFDAPPVPAASFGDYYGALIAQMGVDVQQCERMAEGQSVLVIHMQNQRESAFGVSLDEEMANMVKYQKSYGAAARVVTMIDSMLERILNMGITR
ncbi:MAG TPA: flagellar hook-associated protein FlgK [Peptococcaceae bacterium]|nr:flagellar hook-associated protein FlgK [Peptococcaceae bacterium]